MPQRETITVKHEYTPDELRDIALQMANRIGELESKEDEKKTVVSQFKAELDKIQADINLLSTHYRSGYDFRETRCDIVLDYVDRKRRYYAVDTGELVHEEPLRAEDYQTEAFDHSVDNDPQDAEVVPDDMKMLTDGSESSDPEDEETPAAVGE